MKEIPEPTLRDWDAIQEDIEESYKCPQCGGTGKITNISIGQKCRCHKCNGQGRLDYNVNKETK